MKVFVGVYEHKHGRDIAVFATAEAAEASRVAIAEQWWEHEMSEGRRKPKTPKATADKYFEVMAARGQEFHEVLELEVIGEQEEVASV
jgi:hypothetical protein